MFRPLLVSFGLVVILTATLPAGESKRIEPEKLKGIVKLLVDGLGTPADAPLKVMLDADRAMGLAIEKRGAILIPDSRLSAETLAKIDKEIVPIGVLFMHRITPISAGQHVRAEQHRTVEITADGTQVKISVMYLGVTKVADRLVLLVYTSDKAPAIVTTMIDALETRETPLDLEAQAAGENRATAILTIANKYRTAIEVTAID